MGLLISIIHSMFKNLYKMKKNEAQCSLSMLEPNINMSTSPFIIIITIIFIDLYLTVTRVKVSPKLTLFYFLSLKL